MAYWPYHLTALPRPNNVFQADLFRFVRFGVRDADADQIATDMLITAIENRAMLSAIAKVSR